VLLPWSILLPAALAAAWKSPTAGVRHALAWATVVVGFFSFSQTKIPTYVLSAFPPLLALTAVYVDDVLTRRVEMPRAMEFATVGWTVLAAAIAVAGAVWIVIESPASWTRPVLAAPAIAIAVWTYRHARDSAALAAAIVGSSLALIAMVYGGAADAVNARESQRDAARIVLDLVPPWSALTSYRVAPHALAFYAGRYIRRADDPESAVPELFAGSDAALLTRAKFLQELGLDPMPSWMKLVWTAGDGQVLVLGGRPAEEFAAGQARWRRREGVEPSADR